MSEGENARELLIRFLKQRAELGERDWFLEGLTAERALELLRSRTPRFAPAPAPSHTRPLRSAADPSAAPATWPGTGAGAGTAAGSASPEFEALRDEVLACTLCRLAEGRTSVVFGEGDPHADLLVIGEAPGHAEDRSGRPFVGPAGKLLDKMLLAVGFLRAEVFICNVLKCRPPENRDPWPDEVASCRPYLRRQLELIAPKAICAFGRFAAQTLLNSDQSLSRLRGTVHEFIGTPVIVTYHPAALLRNAQWKRPAWDDLKLLRRVYDEGGGRTPRGELG
ncbi:MAG: uracil-DNA glycosylase [Gemmatimonadota bacterium]